MARADPAPRALAGAPQGACRGQAVKALDTETVLVDVGPRVEKEHERCCAKEH